MKLVQAKAAVSPQVPEFPKEWILVSEPIPAAVVEAGKTVIGRFGLQGRWPLSLGGHPGRETSGRHPSGRPPELPDPHHTR